MRTLFIAMSVGMLTSFAVATADPYAWSPALAGYYDAVAQHIQTARSSGVDSPPSCDLSKVQLPVAPTPLPSPNGLTLEFVAVGRGIQNYTCANSTSSATPAALGAVASLFNASCLAANYPDLLNMIPNIALQNTNPPIRPVTPAPNPATLAPSNIQLSGHHYFATNTTPVFELDSATDDAEHMGVIIGKKSANSTAPAGSSLGVGGVGNGATSWLYLTATNKSETVTAQGDIKVGADASGDEWAAVYRLQTAGGNAPKTCEGISADPQGFSVQYAAVYYFFKGASASASQ